ncbi:MAG TPA: FmdB family zinc ribbon protein [Phycisphaerales bacterium]|nr:FmdB family zinc ribbon protein [Phycisphaerales bacterium]
MPTYEYVCEKCGHEFELFQQMSDAVKRKCPKCGKSALKRKIGIGAGVIFKGSGFYETDYRSESYTKAAEAEQKAKSETKGDDKKKDAGASEPAKSETKAETVKESKKEGRGVKVSAGKKAAKKAGVAGKKRR